MSEAASELEFNVGVDVEEIERFAPGGGTDRLFTDEELADASGAGAPAARLAGTWCAKEATVKALWPWVRLDPRRVTVARAADGRPSVAVPGWDGDGGGVRLRVSISHSGNVATAVVVAWGASATGVRPHEGDARA